MNEVLLRFHHIPDIARIDIYEKHGGYAALRKASAMERERILDLIEESGLRGRGGAGFPTATKWRGVWQQTQLPHYFICNIAEGEPGSFKDRELIKNPHQVIEASAISSYAVGAEQAFIYLRGSFAREEMMLKQALQDAQDRRLVGAGGTIPVDVVIHRGEDSYIAGEETALIESLEGKPAIPRTKPPRPHEHGLWDCPTLVNNVETICNVPAILTGGPTLFRAIGTDKSPGTKLFCLSGQISRPGIYELPLGIRLSCLLNDYGGGPLPGRSLQAVFPGGLSTPLLPVQLDPLMDFEGLQQAGSYLGTGGVIVIDDSSAMSDVAVQASSFFDRESCGACPPCTYGTSEVHRLFLQLKDGVENPTAIILKIQDFCEMMKVRGQCAHNRAAALTSLSLLKHFPQHFVSREDAK